MISVEVKINSKTIIHVTAQNISEHYNIEYGKGKQVYLMKNRLTGLETLHNHYFEDGAEVLSHQMIEFSKIKGEK